MGVITCAVVNMVYIRRTPSVSCRESVFMASSDFAT